ncbi:MAG: peptidyl-prolyl cis-trans isomerase [Candidatus Marinimicrobia bacterium]|nr:peptidyl-prolyl cis-trans isomerase [Candidatus Neomarinimicrobiota bacterium]
MATVIGDDRDPVGITVKDFLHSYELSPSPFGNLRGFDDKKAHLNLMTDKKLMVLEALKYGLDNDEKVQIQLEWYKDKAVRHELYNEVVRNQVQISDSELRDAFIKSKTRIGVRLLVTKTLEEAFELRNRLVDGANFEDLAAETFAYPLLAENTFDLWYPLWGQIDESIEQVAFSLELGEISNPVKTKWGYAILKVEDIIQDAIITESEFQRAKKKIERIIRRRREKEIANRFIREFMDPKKVKVYGPSIVFLVEKSKEILSGDHLRLYAEPSKLSDMQMRSYGQELQDHLGDGIVEFEGGRWTIGEFLDKLKKVHPDARPIMTSKNNLKDVVARMVRDEFLAKEGYRRELQHSNYVQEEVRRWKEEIVFNKLRNDILDTVKVTEPELIEYYEDHKSRYMEPDRVNIREIFVRTKNEADQLIDRIRKSEDFADLAQEYSVRTWAAKQGGEFGFFGYGMHGEIGNRALSMNVGELTGPIEIEDETFGRGFSIFQVISKKERRFKTLEEAKTIVQRNLLEKKRNDVLNRFLDSLRGEYTVHVNQELLSKIMTTDDMARGGKVEMIYVPLH